MIQMTLAQAAAFLVLTTAPTGVEFKGISIDTRTLQPGNLFVALPGEHVDGHDFIEASPCKKAPLPH